MEPSDPTEDMRGHALGQLLVWSACAVIAVLAIPDLVASNAGLGPHGARPTNPEISPGAAGWAAAQILMEVSRH